MCNSYEINNDNEDWDDAERQIKGAQGKGNKSMTVSVKSNKPQPGKRKAGEAVEEAYKEELARREKKGKKSGKVKR